MAGGRRSLCRSGTSRRPTAAGQAARVSEEKRDEVDAALWEARLAATEASRAENREATRRLARSNAELLCRQQDAEREAAAVMTFLMKQGQEKAEEIEKLKQELIDLKRQAREEKQLVNELFSLSSERDLLSRLKRSSDFSMRNKLGQLTVTGFDEKILHEERT